MTGTVGRLRWLAAGLAVAIVAAACSSATSSDRVARPGSADAAAVSNDRYTTPDPSAGVAAVSCGSDVVFGDVPTDLRTDQLSRYTELVMDGRTVMRFVIGADVTDAQVERAVRLTRFYLQDVPGSAHGTDKSGVRETLAANNATMVMPNGAHQEGNDIGLPGQELYAAEIAAEGSPWYVENDFEHRDAAMEEIFHQVHDVGIGTNRPGALPDYQAELLARAESTAGTVWGIDAADWIDELRDEGSLAQEYIAAVIDSWYGLWGPFDGDRGMWGAYVAKTRADVRVEDPEGAALLQAFLPDVLEYEAYLDDRFQGTFSLAFDESRPYTHKSQYLRGARLTGANDAGITGNGLDNTLRGNGGDNALDGGAGTDTAIYCSARNQYTVTTENDITTVTGPDGSDTLSNIETISFIDGSIEL
ncbi:MAG: hypothetical protein AAGA65_17275 [Actinomycetota bacterium]